MRISGQVQHIQVLQILDVVQRAMKHHAVETCGAKGSLSPCITQPTSAVRSISASLRECGVSVKVPNSDRIRINSVFIGDLGACSVSLGNAGMRPALGKKTAVARSKKVGFTAESVLSIVDVSILKSVP